MSIIIEYKCRECGSTNIKKNGFNVSGSQQYYCKDCKASKVLNPKNRYTEKRKEEIIRAYYERGSMPVVGRIFRINPETLARWLKKTQNNDLRQTITAPDKDDVLEVDEMWSFVGNKKNPKWLWLAISRNTRHIVAFHLGSRTDIDCLRFYRKNP